VAAPLLDRTQLVPSPCGLHRVGHRRFEQLPFRVVLHELLVASQRRLGQGEGERRTYQRAYRDPPAAPESDAAFLKVGVEIESTRNRSPHGEQLRARHAVQQHLPNVGVAPERTDENQRAVAQNDAERVDLVVLLLLRPTRLVASA
jgi:hypothetical protein